LQLGGLNGFWTVQFSDCRVGQALQACLDESLLCLLHLLVACRACIPPGLPLGLMYNRVWVWDQGWGTKPLLVSMFHSVVGSLIPPVQSLILLCQTPSWLSRMVPVPQPLEVERPAGRMAVEASTRGLFYSCLVVAVLLFLLPLSPEMLSFLHHRRNLQLLTWMSWNIR
ncbi:hypothetical protein GOODEAATRI_025645, partial [Goodea atripinnis]